MLPSPGESSAAVPRLEFPQDFLSGQSQGQQGGVRPSTPQPPALALQQETLPGARGGVGERRGEEENGESQGEPPDKAGLETLGGCSSGLGLGPAPRSLPSCRPARAVTGAQGWNYSQGDPAPELAPAARGQQAAENPSRSQLPSGRCFLSSGQAGQSSASPGAGAGGIGPEGGGVRGRQGPLASSVW